ncbi:hypothetical protein MMC11_004139, partial [Xylographa trunciseda]|nr:hypothetical protein [Xylographa trunciseda]
MYKALLILSTYWLCALAIDPRITLNLDLPSLSKRVPSANEIRCYPDKYDKTGLGDLDKGQFSRSWDKAYLSPTDRLQYQKIWEQVIQPDYGHLYSGDPVVLDSFRKEFSFYFTLDNQQRNDAFYGAQSTIALALAADYNFQAERVFQYFTHETNEAYTQALHNNDPKDKRTASQFVEEYYRKRIYVLVTDKGMKLIAKNSNWPNPQSSSEQIALAQKARAYTASHGESSSSGANADVVPQIEEDQQFKLFEIIKNDIGRVLNTCVKERKHRGYYIHYEGSTLVYAVSMGLPSLNLRYIFDVGWPDTFARIPEKRWSSPIEPPSAEQTSHPIVPESFPMGLRIPDTQTMNRGDTDIEAGNAQRQPPLDATSRCLQIVSHLCALP